MVKRPLQNAEDEQHELVIKAIASADRRLILDLLRDEPQTTGKICQELPWLNRCTVMQHLGVLEKARLVISKKQGRQRWNYLDVSP
ncbi:MAG: helix-turn-helix domain-containing protein, partial [Gammaproteobacteria bacterium]|nr:helix-turn-helix domain-containing protein [Gammaproteobacteria bacterium]